jgi:plastocyanin
VTAVVGIGDSLPQSLQRLFLRGDNRSAATTGEKRVFPAIRIVDQHGRQVASGRRLAGSQVFDVAVGPSGNKIRFVPDTLNTSVGDTVRWTWGSDDHSVTSCTPCTADGQFCSPDNTNCDAGILSNKGSFTSTRLRRLALTLTSALCTVLLE